MKNAVGTGDVATITAVVPIAAGQCIPRRRLFGVAVADAAAGEDVELMLKGVFDLAKVPGDVFTVGALAWVRPDSLVSIDFAAGANILIGVALEPAGAGAATVRVRLNAGYGPI